VNIHPCLKEYLNTWSRVRAIRRHTQSARMACLSVSLYGVRLGPLGTSATVWPIVPAPNEGRWCAWSSRWNNSQGKPKYSEKTCPSATFNHKRDLGSNPGRRGGKPATNRLSYGTARDLKLEWSDAIRNQTERPLFSNRWTVSSLEGRISEISAYGCATLLRPSVDSITGRRTQIFSPEGHSENTKMSMHK
jgi:hypothetical protein